MPRYLTSLGNGTAAARSLEYWRIALLAFLGTLLNGAFLLSSEPTRLRRPVALAVSADGRQVLVANRASGSISIVDAATKTVIHEKVVGGRPADLVWNGGTGPAFVVDEQGHELLVLQINRHSIEPLARMAVASYPVNVRTTANSQSASVASLWSQRLTFVNLADPVRPQVRAVVDLPFPPREQCWTPDEKTLIVADAFGGRLAIVDAVAGQLTAIRQITGHNLRGLTWDHERQNLLVAHQILHGDEETTEGGVHWGGVMSNIVRSIPMSWLLNAPRPLDEGIYYLGNPDRATGDPADLVVTKSRRRIAAYAGLGELGISDIGANVYDHIAVGKRPTALTLSPDEQIVYVANTLDDSISVVPLSSAPAVQTISFGAGRALTAAERGEQLFYDSRLASDGWFSCHSCHTDGHSNGGLSDTLGDASFGAPKRVLSLLGVSETGPWAWNGSVAKLEDQVRKSAQLTMRGPALTDPQVQDLTAYLRTLPAPPSLVAARHGNVLSTEQPALAAAFRRGKELFNSKQCSTCHMPPLYTTEATHDVDLPDERGQRQFNPPSLRGVSQRDRLFHDNRSTGLTEVFAKFHHGLDGQLTDQQIKDLVLFLRSL